MFTRCELLTLTLALTLAGQVQTGRIIGGQVAHPHSRPYMVLLEMHMEDNTVEHCGGFLLNEDFVMTAAHCKAKSYVALLGLHNYHDKSKIRVSVKKAYPHKDYNSTTDDIMLLKLSSKANFTKNVGRIALAGRRDTLPKSCSVSGWGKEDRKNKHMSHVLREVNVTLIDSEKCANNNFYCSEGKTGPYKGDSGGPLVCEDGEAYGVVAANVKDQFYFTKIPDYRCWIDQITNGTL